jgi:hypothetical protein
MSKVQSFSFEQEEGAGRTPIVVFISLLVEYKLQKGLLK